MPNRFEVAGFTAVAVKAAAYCVFRRVTQESANEDPSDATSVTLSAKLPGDEPYDTVGADEGKHVRGIFELVPLV